ncbi:hypothetical protein C7416_103580 [Cupriavidus phytorum]|uniref:Uncharacterized protein n=1 Tax=Cupriavidus phytorum TaxID=3024399 RepID=A0A2W7PEX6_9BURK|nr:hypothetical protein [Cupriavidus alkaliphilus]PZX30847.1 hypothetical protein C7416_103580 [Cupriavidus alkaliphilus]
MEWGNIMGTVRPGTYRAADVPALRLYVDTLVDLRRVEREVQALRAVADKNPTQGNVRRLHQRERALNATRKQVSTQQSRLRLVPSARRDGKQADHTLKGGFAYNSDGSAIKPSWWPEGKPFNARPGIKDCDRGTPDEDLALFGDTETQVALFGCESPHSLSVHPAGTPFVDWQADAKRDERNRRERERRAQARAERMAFALAPRPVGRPCKVAA